MLWTKFMERYWIEYTGHKWKVSIKMDAWEAECGDMN
jgi:hypothetical protein